MIKKQYFTRVELVLVTTISAAAVLTLHAAVAPTDAKVRCQDSLKKFAAATAAYAADADGYLPFPGVLWSSPTGIGKKLDAYIASSVPSKNPELFMCPADEKPMDKRQEGGDKFWSLLPDKKGGYLANSYGINLVVAGVPNNPYFRPTKLSAIDNQEACMIFADASARDIPGDAARIVGRHDGKALLSYADGHVGVIDPADVPRFNSNKHQGFWCGGED